MKIRQHTDLEVYKKGVQYSDAHIRGNEEISERRDLFTH
jgi:hypothetical protein